MCEHIHVEDQIKYEMDQQQIWEIKKYRRLTSMSHMSRVLLWWKIPTGNQK
jgi:hypothetical protein